MSSILLTHATVVSFSSLFPESAVIVGENGKIADILPMASLTEEKTPRGAIVYDVGGAYVLPGLIDTHIHGFGGSGTEDQSTEAILGMSEALADCGVTGFLPTIYTNLPEDMMRAEDAIVAAKGHEKGAKILGINLEGPFISPKHINAQNPEGLRAVDLELFGRFLERGKGLVRCMTVAPELPGIHDLAVMAEKEHVVLSAGHTDALHKDMMAGLEDGIRQVTHLFNAMRPLHHRDLGTAGTALTNPDIRCELICDGVHVNRDLDRFLFRVKPVRSVTLVTDALKPTEQKKGPFFANGVPAELSPRGVWVKKGDPSLILGSALTLQRAVKNAVTWGGVSLPDASRMASTNPAENYGFEGKGVLLPGRDADFTVLNADFSLKALFIAGKKIR